MYAVRGVEGSLFAFEYAGLHHVTISRLVLLGSWIVANSRIINMRNIMVGLGFRSSVQGTEDSERIPASGALEWGERDA